LIFDHLAGPDNTSGANVDHGFADNISSYATSGGTNIIENFVSSEGATDDVTVEPRTTLGNSTWLIEEGVPNNVGIVNADLYLKFKLANTLPMYSLILITFPFSISLSVGEYQNMFWSNYKHSSLAVVSATSISMQISESYGSGDEI
jgi:hypothetical protein